MSSLFNLLLSPNPQYQHEAPAALSKTKSFRDPPPRDLEILRSWPCLRRDEDQRSHDFGVLKSAALSKPFHKGLVDWDMPSVPKGGGKSKVNETTWYYEVIYKFMIYALIEFIKCGFSPGDPSAANEKQYEKYVSWVLDTSRTNEKLTLPTCNIL